MAHIIATEFVSIDGIMQAPGGGEDYKHAGWTFKVNRGPEGDTFKLQETMDTEALLLGRVTYEGFAQAWPTMKNEFADKFNSMPKYVVSSTLKNPTWSNTSVLEGSFVESVTKLRDEIKGTIAVHGSAQVVQGLIQHNLLDELRLMIFPVLLGSGKKLFGDTTDLTWMELKDMQKMGDDVVTLTYLRKEK